MRIITINIWKTRNPPAHEHIALVKLHTHTGFCVYLDELQLQPAAGNTFKNVQKHTHSHSICTDSVIYLITPIWCRAVRSESCQQQPVRCTWHMVRELVEMHGFNLSALTDKWTGRRRCCSETCCSARSVCLTDREHQGEREKEREGEQERWRDGQKLVAWIYSRVMLRQRVEEEGDLRPQAKWSSFMMPNASI